MSRPIGLKVPLLLTVLAILLVAGVVVFDSPTASACDGVKRYNRNSGVFECVVQSPPNPGEKASGDSDEQGDSSGSNQDDSGAGGAHPDPETVRMWEVQESVEFMCREFGVCLGDDAWEDSQCSMDPDAPYGTGRGLPGERCPTYIQPEDERDTGGDDSGDDEPPTITPEQAAEQVIAKLKFTAGDPQVGPNRDHHDFPFDTAVGYPVWLWTTGGTTNDSVTETVGPLTVSISIRLDKVVWDLGDGTTLRCDTGTKWRRGTAPGKKSPTCGHAYEVPGKYTIEATSQWTITWSAGGQSGTMPYSITTGRPFEVGEIHVLVR